METNSQAITELIKIYNKLVKTIKREAPDVCWDVAFEMEDIKIIATALNKKYPESIQINGILDNIKVFDKGEIPEYIDPLEV